MNATFQTILRAWARVSPRRRFQIFLLGALMVLASLAEIASLGAVVPFLAVITAPERLFAHPLVSEIARFLGIHSPQGLLFPITAGFILAAAGCSFLRMLVLWASTRLAFGAGADISHEIYMRTLYQPYAVHLARNSSEIVAGITSKTQNAIWILISILNAVAAIFFLIAIMCTLLYIDAVSTCIAFGSLGLVYAVLMRASERKLRENSRCIAEESSRVVQCLNEGLGGIRDVLIDGCQEVYCDAYRKADLPRRRAEGINQIIGQGPRYLLEAFGMGLLAAMAYGMVLRGGMDRALPVIGSLTMGMQRLMPVLQQLYSSWVTLMGNATVLQEILDLLEQPLPKTLGGPEAKIEPMPFRRDIRLCGVGFRYGEEHPWVFRNVDLTIPKGCRMGFAGETGSGKTTLLDIVMGLLPPTEGSLQVDGAPVTEENRRAWQVHIAHVPQSIFLSDTTIEENIAFGVPKNRIDSERVRDAARKACIADVIERMPKKYKTKVGERGVRLSGGQRQRIGIARALYKKADVLVFDEATSALDNATEASVMEAVDRLDPDLTVLIIAHRLSTLQNCTHIVRVGGGGLCCEKK